MSEYTPWLKGHGVDLTIGDDLASYLNQAAVKTALNIPDTNATFNNTWYGCTNSDKFDYNYAVEASMWIYNILKLNNIRIMFYSGDTDGAINTYATKRWIEDLNWDTKVNGSWAAWKTDGQVSGYVTQYEGLDFVTVKGVGHMAPQWARKPVFEMINNWIHNIPWTALQ
jgi:carboxypeptidase C (cathepsin A)